MSWMIGQFLPTWRIAPFCHQMTVLMGWVGYRNKALQSNELIFIVFDTFSLDINIDYYITPFTIHILSHNDYEIWEVIIQQFSLGAPI